MSLELSAIAFTVVKSIFPPVAKALVAKVNSEFNPTDLEKALKAGITAADEWDRTKPLSQQVFYDCADKEARDLLERFFKDTGVQDELKKPLQQKGKPDLDFLIESFKKAASEPKPNFPENSIESWLKKFVDTYFENTSAYLKFQLAKDHYLNELAARFSDIKFAGIKVEAREEEKSAKLEQIFVMPDVLEEVQGQEITPFARDFNLQGKINNRQAELFWEQRQLTRLGEDTGRTFLAQQLLSESTSNKFVLLGAPGSGKTTLMSYFAVMLALKKPQQLGLAPNTDLLPILIKIRDLSRYRDINILDYLKQVVCKHFFVKRELPNEFFENWLEDGRALILLDGLDEVAEEARQFEVVELIESFLRQYSQNRAIITSRPAGYKRAFFRTDEFPQYRLQLFDDAKIDLFIEHWYESRFKDSEERKRRQESLRKALAEQNRIKLLARNPLLLTIISLIHRYTYLPRQRYKLYQQAVETLLTAWDTNKELNEHWSMEYLKPEDLERLMQQLAYWIHTHGGTGDDEGGTLIDKDELVRQLRDYIAEKKRKQIDDREQAEVEAKRLVEHIKNRAGLLNEQGKDCYAFVHKTFQEYLAAEEIRDRQDGDGDKVVLEHIQNYLHDAHWREVLLLLIAQQHRRKSPIVLEEILKQDTPYEQWLHRNLFFAGSCLAEDLEVSDDSVVTEILRQLVALEVGDSKRVGFRIRSQVFKILCSLSETQFAGQALQLLKESENRINKLRLQAYRAALGEKEEAIAALLPLLKDEKPGVYYHAAEALGKLGKDSETVVPQLLPLLKHEEYRVRASAAEALGKLGKDTETVVPQLLSLLKHEEYRVRASAAEVLGNLGKDSETVVPQLLPLLKDEESLVRAWAAQALGNLGKDSETVVPQLLPLLKDEESLVRAWAAQALGNLGKDSETVVPQLLPLLKDEEYEVRYYAAHALGKLGKDSETVVSQLLPLLKDEESSVRASAAEALGTLGKDSETVVPQLLPLLKDEEDWVRASAAAALGKLGKDSETVVPSVAEWISQHQDSEYVGNGIDVLWDLVAEEVKNS
jgi:HEAT repeat protein